MFNQYIKIIHDKHIIHLDIKPDNSITGRYSENNPHLYIIATDLAK